MTDDRDAYDNPFDKLKEDLEKSDQEQSPNSKKVVHLDLDGLMDKKLFERRSEPRYQVECKVIFDEGQLTRTYNGLFVNVSQNGLCIFMPTSDVEPGRTYRIECIGNQSLSPFIVEAKLIRDLRDNKIKRSILGFRITNKIANAEAVIENFLRSQKD